ncbi:MAG: PAS domain S-box protein [Calditrichaeota bacterium]|nr:PAS domain S-box protein [Calditrichota bacterium]
MKEVKILYLEDNADDFELVRSLLREEGLVVDLVQASTPEMFKKKLKQESFDLILCDYSIPAYSGADALKLVRHDFPEVPFIFVSATLGEESAIETLKNGATDYVLKQRLARLIPAIRRALKENEQLQKRRISEEIRNRYDFIVNTSRSFMLLINRKYCYEAINRAFCQAHKLIPGQVTGRSVAEIWGEKVFQEIMKPKLDLCLQGKEVTYEAWLETKNYGRRCYEIANIPYRANGDKITHVVEIVSDVTEKKQFEQELVRERDWAQKYLDVAGVIFVVIGVDEKVAMINKKGREILNCSEEEIVGSDWFATFVPKSERARARQIFKKLLASPEGEFQYTEMAVIPNKGSRSPLIIAWHNTPLDDEQGNRIGILASGEDVTDRKTMEDSLRASEERYRTLVEGSGQAIISVNRSGKILFLNRISEKILNLPSTHGYGKKVEDILPRELGYALSENIRQVIKSRAPLITENSAKINGGRRWFEWRIYPLRSNHDVDSALIIAMDVTERKLADVKLRQSYEKMQKTLQGIVTALTATIEIRDPYTAGHQRRVSELTCMIAEEMGLSKDKIEGIRIASLMHDIGKIYVPTEILSKPGKLSDSEFDLIKIHPRAGYDILKSIDFPWPIAQAILQHHERMDGSGYPDGLLGPEIIVEARIIAAADVVETMASHRPYRPAKGIKEAIKEIKSGRGIYYDSEIVDICLKFYREKKFKFLEEK